MNTLRRLTSKAKTKLTYTGPTFELSVDSDTFSPRVVAHHGMPYPCTAIAYDALLGLVAAGSIFGDIKLFGGNGVEATLHATCVAKVVQLFFLPGQARLVSIDSKNHMQLWSLKDQGPIRRVSFKETLTCAVMSLGGTYCYLGLDDGRVLVFDLVAFQMCKYSISPPEACADTPVSCIVSNPANENSLLISYDNSSLVLWDMNRETVALTYQNECPTQTMSWHPTGEQFVTGHEDGSLVLWDIGAGKPMRRFCITEDSGKRSPVRQVEWACGGGVYGTEKPSNIVVTGGMLDYEPHGVVLLTGEKYGTHILVALDDDCDYFIVINRENGGPDDPPRALLTFSRCQLVLHDIRFKGRASSSILPSLAFPQATAMSDCYDMPSAIVHMLELTQQTGGRADDEGGRTMMDLGLVDGGTVSYSPPDASRQRVFATGHTDGFVQIWEIGRNASLRRIAVLKMEQLPIDDKLEFVTITVARLTNDSRGDTLLTLGFKTGHVAMLELGSQRLNMRSCVDLYGHAVTVIAPILTNLLVAGDSHGGLMLLDSKTGKQLSKLQLESTAAITCIEFVDLTTMTQQRPSSAKQASSQVHNQAKIIVLSAKATDVLYCGSANGGIHVVSLQTFTTLYIFSAKKPSRLHALVAFDRSWNRHTSSTTSARSKRQNQATKTEDDPTDGSTHPLLAVSENHVRIYSLPDNTYLSKVTPEGAIHMAFLKPMLDAIFLVCFVDVAADEDGDNHGKMRAALVVYSLPTLSLVSRQPVPFNIKNLSNAMCPDEDTVVVLTDHGEVIQLGLLAHPPPTVTGRIASVTLITEKTSTAVATAAMRDKANHKLKAVGTSFKAVKSLFKRGDKKEPLVDEHVNMDVLLKDRMSQDELVSLLDIEDNPFSEAMRALQERGEKLQELSNKTADMAEEAAHFYELSRNLRRSQQRRSMLT